MPATKLRYGPGGKDIDLPPTADSSIYCESIFPFHRDAKFSTAMAIPDVLSLNAGKCDVQIPAPSQAQSPSAWGLPSIYGTNPALSKLNERQWFFDTRDSNLTGEGPQLAGWREPPMPTAASVAQAAGGKKQKSRSHMGKSAKSVKTRKGKAKRGKGKTLGKSTRKNSKRK